MDEKHKLILVYDKLKVAPYSEYNEHQLDEKYNIFPHQLRDDSISSAAQTYYICSQRKHLTSDTTSEFPENEMILRHQAVAVMRML
mmetsp:Transcript_20346/g.20622  ORF Transcript_20346/g.20622 Transcript_20346/m.20622 type:complete len:86 (-) Transcript_20346:365-622(-)